MEERIKKLEEQQRKIIKKFLVIVFAVGIICTTFGVAAGSYTAKQITFRPSDSTWKVNNVSDAIDSIKYNKTSDNYSTEEQVVGTWIDGKPIYQKTYNFLPIALTSDKQLDISSYISNYTTFNYIISCIGVKRGSEYSYRGAVYLSSELSTSGDSFKITSPVGYTIDSIIIQYTKTTDEVTN